MAAGHHINVRLARGFRESRKDFEAGRPRRRFFDFLSARRQLARLKSSE
jgi:hypothetical protein